MPNISRYVAQVRGIEPLLAALETAALPLRQTRMLTTSGTRWSRATILLVAVVLVAATQLSSYYS